MSGVVAPEVLGAAPALRQQFDEAAPFRHVLIENFFVAGFARALLEQFPPPAGATRNPFGAAGAKAFCSDLALLGPAYREVHQYLGSAPFLNWVGAITGIEALVYDQTNFGGGTHENFDGRDLRPHVDFNYHPVTKLHRRVNMIVYLNEVWEPQWGGAITLARDPRDPFSEAVAYEPTFNRCIIFETSEHSWHGFERVALPVGQQHRTRKSLSIYLYSREREAGQIHREHTTFFVPRPLPSRFAGGYTLSEDDASELGELMGHRDRLIALYHREQGKQEDGSAEAARLRIRVAELQAKLPFPTMGYVRAENTVGAYSDGWVAGELRFTLVADRPVCAMNMRMRVPEGVPTGTIIAVEVDGVGRTECVVAAGACEVQSAMWLEAGGTARIRIATSATVNHRKLGLSEDERELGFFPECAIFEHRSP